MIVWQRYLQPHTVAEALAGLAAAAGPARIIGGGTDLLLDIQQGRQPPVETLVDVTGIPELVAIRIDEAGIFIGAAVTHHEIICHPLLARRARALVQASGLIGGPQVRNVATLGGNIAHALPAGDATIALLALDAVAEVAGPAGRRHVPLAELFLAPGRTVLGPAELLVGVHLPRLGPGEGSAFARVMRPQGVAIAILNLAAWLRVAGDGTILAARLAVGPAGPVPFRARRAEAALAGRRLDPDGAAPASVAAELLAEAQLRTSPHRATAEYRRQLVPVVLQRVLAGALAAASEKESA